MFNMAINSLTYIMFLLLPYYYLQSGSIQPVDFVIFFLFSLLVLSKNTISYSIRGVSVIYFWLMMLFIYSILIFILSYIVDHQSETLQLMAQTIYYMLLSFMYLSLLYYFYNSCSKQKFYEKMIKFLMISTIVPLIFLLIKQKIGLSRAELSFNNPNQLAIYAMLNMAIFFYMSLFAIANHLKVNRIVSLLLINLYVVFLSMSASRAAFGLLLMYVMSYFLIFPFKQVRENPIGSWIIIMLILAIPGWLLFNKFIIHMESLRENNLFILNNLQTDSYVRMFQGINYNLSNLYYFLFGVGQSSNPWRLDHLEFHNNFIGIFNQIGIFGFILYLILNIYIVIALLRQGFIYLIPYLCYLELALFHYVFRERVNWWFMAVLIFITIYKKIDAKKNYIVNDISIEESAMDVWHRGCN